MTQTLIVDTDTASDDAVALIMALRAPRRAGPGHHHPGGECALEQGSRNARYTVELWGARSLA